MLALNFVFYMNMLHHYCTFLRRWQLVEDQNQRQRWTPVAASFEAEEVQPIGDFQSIKLGVGSRLRERNLRRATTQILMCPK